MEKAAALRFGVAAVNFSGMAMRTRLDRSLAWGIPLALLLGCFYVLRPFFSPLLWGIVLCFSSWPIYRRLLRVLGNRRTLAALIMTLGMALIVLLPFLVIGLTLATNVEQFTTATRKWIETAVTPTPPAWVAKLPLIGERAGDYWQSMAEDPKAVWADVESYIKPVSAWLLRTGFALGGGLVQLALSIFIAFFLFRDGVAAAARLSAGVERVAGEQGRHLLEVAGKTVRGVVYGILGTALAQAIMAGIGFLIAGVPAAGLLALLTFFSSIVPIVGTALVWLPAALWLFHVGSAGWGIFMLIWGFAVGNLDNVVKPWLISQGSDMPFILIFFGVIGGAFAFGFIGVFLGPTLLAVGFRLVEAWISTVRKMPSQDPAPQVVAK
jgi:predicted PurR-regulated permease PerM